MTDNDINTLPLDKRKSYTDIWKHLEQLLGLDITKKAFSQEKEFLKRHIMKTDWSEARIMREEYLSALSALEEVYDSYIKRK